MSNCPEPRSGVPEVIFVGKSTTFFFVLLPLKILLDSFSILCDKKEQLAKNFTKPVLCCQIMGDLLGSLIPAPFMVQVHRCLFSCFDTNSSEVIQQNSHVIK